MKKYSIIVSASACSLLLLLAQCKKENLELSGTASTAGFTFLQEPVGDTLPFVPKVKFTNTSTGEFLYQWSFGDNTDLASQKEPLHTFKIGGNYNVTLTTVGTNGSNSISKVVSVVDACQNDFFNKLTNCTTGNWTWSNDADAIKVLSPDASSVYFAGTPAGCQADDVYKFGTDGKFTYDANGQTFDVQSGYSCQPPKANAPAYKVIARAGQQPVIYLDTIAVGKPFIGTTDIVDSNKYKVMSYTDNTMTLRSTISGGNLLEVKLRKVVVLTIDDIKNILTGGSSKTWRLDPAPGANPIIVGTEANPSQYFGGGALDVVCQSDDVYTFTSTNKLTYNANGATFNGGNVAPNYTCGSDRGYNNIAYNFAATTPGLAGLATITLPGSAAPPTIFIGVTDVPSENVYRIIEISTTKMVLRAGNGSGTVFQFKFIAL